MDKTYIYVVNTLFGTLLRICVIDFESRTNTLRKTKRILLN